MYLSFSNKKSSGPDGVANEVLKMLPFDIQDTIHKLSVIM